MYRKEHEIKVTVNGLEIDKVKILGYEKDINQIGSITCRLEVEIPEGIIY